MNILVLSCGTRNKIIQYFKKELSGTGQVVAADCSPIAPALYEADRYYIVPPITDAGYIEEILEICKKEKVNALFSLIDPELTIIAQNKQRFLEKGITPVVSDFSVVDICFDKYKMFEFCRENGIPTVLTYKDFGNFLKDYRDEKINFPVFVKPRWGSCSVEAQRIDSLEKLQLLCGQNPDLIIQECMEGTEIGADVYVDLLSGEVVSIFTKEKLLMRAGETDKAVSIKNNELFHAIGHFVKSLGASGMIDIDIFQKDGEYLISEVNPRFGGGYPHAYECGVNFPKFILNNVDGRQNPVSIGDYEAGVYMMKYLDVKIVSSIEKGKMK